jgi:hypothetical protein
VAEDAAVVNAQTFKDTIAIKETVIVHGDFCITRGHKLAI